MADVVDVKAGIKNVLDRIGVACENRPKEVNSNFLWKRQFNE